MSDPRPVVPVTVSPAVVVQLTDAITASLLEKLLDLGVIEEIPEGLVRVLQRHRSAYLRQIEPSGIIAP